MTITIQATKDELMMNPRDFATRFLEPAVAQAKEVLKQHENELLDILIEVRG